MTHEIGLRQYDLLNISGGNTLYQGASIKYAICPGEAGGNLKEFE